MSGNLMLDDESATAWKDTEEAMKHTQEVIKIWIECAKEDGKEIPEPHVNQSLLACG